jgi:hypothetical protein
MLDRLPSFEEYENRIVNEGGNKSVAYYLEQGTDEYITLAKSLKSLRVHMITAINGILINDVNDESVLPIGWVETKDKIDQYMAKVILVDTGEKSDTTLRKANTRWSNALIKYNTDALNNFGIPLGIDNITIKSSDTFNGGYEANSNITGSFLKIGNITNKDKGDFDDKLREIVKYKF